MDDVIDELLVSTMCITWGPNIVGFIWSCYIIESFKIDGRKYVKVHCADNTDIDTILGPMCCECGEFPYSKDN
jgi:hypothetical protein